MEYNFFTKKLYDIHKKDNQSKEVNNKMYGEILSNIFCDVEKFEDAFYGMVNVSENFDGKYKTLGEYFSKSENNGIDIVTTTCVITNIQYMFHFYDDKFTMKAIEYNGSECSYLMQPKYQKRYVAEMYKMFGEPYKNEYKNIISQKQKLLDEESGFLK